MWSLGLAWSDYNNFFFKSKFPFSILIFNHLEETYRKPKTAHEMTQTLFWCAEPHPHAHAHPHSFFKYDRTRTVTRTVVQSFFGQFCMKNTNFFPISAIFTWILCDIFSNFIIIAIFPVIGWLQSIKLVIQKELCNVYCTTSNFVGFCRLL